MTQCHTHAGREAETHIRIERENVIYKNDRHFYFATCHTAAGPCRSASLPSIPLPSLAPHLLPYAEWNAVKNGGCVTSHASWVCHTYHTRLNYNRAAGIVAQKQRHLPPSPHSSSSLLHFASSAASEICAIDCVSVDCLSLSGLSLCPSLSFAYSLGPSL